MSPAPPILRMYEYERVRNVTYQMDFWLNEHDTFLNCRICIRNQTDQVIPMYWWSNMAVPEYENGRVIAPAKDAYTNRGDGVYKVSVPLVDGIDISHYKNIPKQVDYFFNIPETMPKYIANINQDGYGLLHISTERLKSRKLFSWGNNEASENWQNFLTKDAGRYVEIQAGLGKTQYGCIPMAPHTTWEWLELYGPVHAPSASDAPYSHAEKELRSIVSFHLKNKNLEERLLSTRGIAKKKGTLILKGSGYGAFENAPRKHNQEPLLSEHLDFGSISEEYRKLASFLEDGIFPEPPVRAVPHDFIADHTLHDALLNTIETINKDNWYAHYQLGLSFFIKNDFANAGKHLTLSNTIKENPWALHALSVLEIKKNNDKKAVSLIIKGYSYVKDDLSFLKETWKILLLCNAYDVLKEIYNTLPEAFAQESRIHFGYLTALSRTGHEKEVLDYMNTHPLILDDLRECEDTLGALWNEVYEKVHGYSEKVPQIYNFNSL